MYKTDRVSAALYTDSCRNSICHLQHVWYQKNDLCLASLAWAACICNAQAELYAGYVASRVLMQAFVLGDGGGGGALGGFRDDLVDSRLPIYLLLKRAKV